MADIPRRGVDQTAAAFVARNGQRSLESHKGFTIVGNATEQRTSRRFVAAGTGSETQNRNRGFVRTDAKTTREPTVIKTVEVQAKSQDGSETPQVVDQDIPEYPSELAASRPAQPTLEVTYTAEGDMEVFGIRFHPVGQKQKDDNDTQNPTNHSSRRRRNKAGSMATAAVASAALAACTSPSSTTQAHIPPPSRYSSSTAAFDPGVSSDGRIDWGTTVADFGSIPQAVRGRENDVFKVTNMVTARVDDGGEISTDQEHIEATGSVATVNGRRVGLTAGHVYRGDVLSDGSILTYSCGNSTDLFPGGTIRVRAAASQFDPYPTAVGNESIDLAVTSPAPASVEAIPSGGVPKISQRVFIESLQPLSPDGHVLDPHEGQKPSLIEGVVIGLLPQTTDLYVVLTGFGGSRKGIYETAPGASGGPVMNSAGQRIGVEVMGSDAIHVPAGGQLSSSDLSALQVNYGFKGIYVEPDAGPIDFYLSVIQADAAPADQKAIRRGVAHIDDKQNACR